MNLDNEQAIIDEDYYTKGNLEAGIEGLLINNNKMFNEVKSKTWSQTFSTPNINYKVGAEDGVRYVQYEQKNVEAIREECKNLREFYKVHGTDNPFFAGTAHMMNLPKCFAHEISSKWFNNRPWDLIKLDKSDKLKFYEIVNQHYSDFICHPSGKIPLPKNVLIQTV